MYTATFLWYNKFVFTTPGEKARRPPAKEIIDDEEENYVIENIKCY